MRDERSVATAGFSAAPEVTVRAEWFLWVRGQEAAAQAGEFLAVMNPATGEEFCRVARAQAADVDAAVEAASEALPLWAGMPSAARGRIMLEVARRLRETEDELALLETLNNGKPLPAS